HWQCSLEGWWATRLASGLEGSLPTLLRIINPPGSFESRLRTGLSFPGSAWERTVLQALPAPEMARRSLASSAFPGRAWEREIARGVSRAALRVRRGIPLSRKVQERGYNRRGWASCLRTSARFLAEILRDHACTPALPRRSRAGREASEARARQQLCLEGEPDRRPRLGDRRLRRLEMGPRPRRRGASRQRQPLHHRQRLCPGHESGLDLGGPQRHLL